MTVLADIAHGHVDFADVCFLIAGILGVIAGFIALTSESARAATVVTPLGWFAVAFLAVGFLAL